MNATPMRTALIQLAVTVAPANTAMMETDSTVPVTVKHQHDKIKLIAAYHS